MSKPQYGSIALQIMRQWIARALENGVYCPASAPVAMPEKVWCCISTAKVAKDGILHLNTLSLSALS